MKKLNLLFKVALTVCLPCISGLNGMGQDSPQHEFLIIEDGGTGPYKAVVHGEPDLPGYTIFRPQDLNVFGNDKSLPVLLWGNGGCANSSAGFRNFLNEIASYGYLVIAIGPYETLVVPDQEIIRQPTKSAQLTEALDWITHENQNRNCMFYGKVNTSKAAVAGQSCGGLQAMEVSTDSRITTTLICNSGLLNSPPPAGITVPVVSKDVLQELHAPLIYIIGGEADIAFPNASDDFSKITKVPVVMVNQEVGHGGTYAQPHGGDFAVAALAWLNWQLKGDQEASKMFLGEDCGLCKETDWKVEVKGF